VLVNNYGPTEATVVATSGVVPAQSDGASMPSIGRPILNTQIHILDEDMQPVPTGEAGELYIGGRGVARGYRNRPDLTAERFVPDPFTEIPGARLYRTGDLARSRSDGEIDFIGRIDQQVKIRGFRIELGEVEAVLMEHAGVSQAAAVAPEGASGTRTLVAYVVCPQASGAAADDLRRFLMTRLPDYMVPARVVALERLPLTSSGKINRGALGVMAAEELERDRVLEEPRTLIEQRLTAIVAALLKLEHVGVDENFFSLGGHSLLGAQLIARINEVFGVSLPLRTLFDSPTVAGLSSEIERVLLEKLEAREIESPVRAG
jgi:acyl-coenzyme A synthetase/AMP-(fatty) acid ligase